MFTEPEKVHQLSNANFKMVAGKVKLCMENNKPVIKGLMIAYAPWCPHCHTMESVWKNLSKKHKMYALDADSNSEARNQIELEGYPSFYTVNTSGSLKPVEVEDRTESGVEKVIKKFIKDAKKRSKKRSNKKSKKRRSKKGIAKKQKGGMRKRPGLSINPDVPQTKTEEERIEEVLNPALVKLAKENAIINNTSWQEEASKIQGKQAWF